MMRSSVNGVSRAALKANYKALTWENVVSEGGLEPPRRCCITDSVMYHHSKVARRRCPARQFAMGVSGSRQSSLPGPEPWESGGPGSPLEEDDQEGCRAASPASVPFRQAQHGQDQQA